MRVAGTDSVGGGLDAVGHLLGAFHALRPGGRPAPGGRAGLG